MCVYRNENDRTTKFKIEVAKLWRIVEYIYIDDDRIENRIE